MAAPLNPERSLGATGIKVPLLGYGTAPLGKPEISREHAVRCLNHAIDQGITYLDTSPDYGSQPHLGEVMRTRRNEVFLATKVNHRRKQDVLNELKDNLRQLQTDHVDLIQVHAVNAWADLEQALAPDGAVAALEQARSEGLVRFIGITGHARPEVLAEGLRRFSFDTVLVALGVADYLVTGPQNIVLPEAQKRNRGVIAMKVLGHGNFNNREKALRFSLGFPGVSLAIVGMKSPQQIDEMVTHASNYSALNESEQNQLIEEVKSLVTKDAEESKKGQSALFWLHDTTVMGWKEQSEPAMVDY
ncbi:MAG TPA: aldo/keto reductase [Chloroflexia bacterium]|nr:aldo/keto reductase [Chloroflexia bacterium]